MGGLHNVHVPTATLIHSSCHAGHCSTGPLNSNRLSFSCTRRVLALSTSVPSAYTSAAQVYHAPYHKVPRSETICNLKELCYNSSSTSSRSQVDGPEWSSRWQREGEDRNRRAPHHTSPSFL